MLSTPQPGQWQLDLSQHVPVIAPGFYDIVAENSAGTVSDRVQLIASEPEILPESLVFILSGQVSYNIVLVQALGQSVTPVNGRYELRINAGQITRIISVTITSDDGRTQTRRIAITALAANG